MALLFSPDEWAQILAPKNGRTFTAAELVELVGGKVRMCGDSALRPYVALVDEDGANKQLPHNRLASMLVGFCVVGKAILLRPEEIE